MSFPMGTIAGDGPSTKVIFGASYAKGSYDDHNSVTLLHYPAESTEETVFSFRLTEDMAGVDVLREQLTVRENSPLTVRENSLLTVREQLTVRENSLLPQLIVATAVSRSELLPCRGEKIRTNGRRVGSRGTFAFVPLGCGAVLCVLRLCRVAFCVRSGSLCLTRCAACLGCGCW